MNIPPLEEMPKLDTNVVALIDVEYDEGHPGSYRGVRVGCRKRGGAYGGVKYGLRFAGGNPQADFTDALCAAWEVSAIIHEGSVAHFVLDGGTLDEDKAYAEARDRMDAFREEVT